MYSGNKNIKNTFLIKQYFPTYVALSSPFENGYIKVYIKLFEMVT